jgi:hypothetical protein
MNCEEAEEMQCYTLVMAESRPTGSTDAVIIFVPGSNEYNSLSVCLFSQPGSGL